MLNQNFVILGSITVTLGSISYLIDTVKGKIKPNKVSFLLWSIAPMIAFFAELKQGVGLQSLMTFTVGFLPFTIFVASFFNKKAEWKLRKFDFVCGGLSIIGLILWYITKSGNIAIIFSILADGMAALPTFVKSFYYPETESIWGYLPSSISGIITLLTVKNWNVATVGYPLYITLSSGIDWIFIQFKPGKLLKAKKE